MVFSAVALFGIGWPFTKYVLHWIPPLPFLALEVSASALGAIVFAFIVRATWPNRKGMLAYAGLGLLSPGINYAFAIGGLSLTSASAASLISATEPLAILLLAIVVLRERIGLWQAWLVALAFLGMVLVEDPFSPGGHTSLVGTTIVAIGVMFSALFVVLQRRAPDADPFAGAAIQQIVGACFLIAASFIVHGTHTISLVSALPTIPFVATIAAGVLLDFAPFLLLILASTRYSGASSGMAFTLMPVIGVSLSVLTLGERPSVLQLIGGVTIIVALVLFERLAEAIPPEQIRRPGQFVA